MKVINGKKYYKKKEVAELVGRSPQTINLWDKWSREREEEGKERFIPKPHRADNNYRYWSEEDVEEIIEFRKQIRYGDLVEYTKRRQS